MFDEIATSRTYVPGVFLVAILIFSATPASNAFSFQGNLADANAAIASAFVSLHDAEASNGNVTLLANELNLALNLVQKARLENSTNPSQALDDLRNATQIAQSVQQASLQVKDEGSIARTYQEYFDFGLSAIVIAVAGVLYFYGERMYLWFWLKLYGNFVVRR